MYCGGYPQKDIPDAVGLTLRGVSASVKWMIADTVHRMDASSRRLLCRRLLHRSLVSMTRRQERKHWEDKVILSEDLQKERDDAVDTLDGDDLQRWAETGFRRVIQGLNASDAWVRRKIAPTDEARAWDMLDYNRRDRRMTLDRYGVDSCTDRPIGQRPVFNLNEF